MPVPVEFTTDALEQRLNILRDARVQTDRLVDALSTLAMWAQHTRTRARLRETDAVTLVLTRLSDGMECGGGIGSGSGSENGRGDPRVVRAAAHLLALIAMCDGAFPATSLDVDAAAAAHRLADQLAASTFATALSETDPCVMRAGAVPPLVVLMAQHTQAFADARTRRLALHKAARNPLQQPPDYSRRAATHAAAIRVLCTAVRILLTAPECRAALIGILGSVRVLADCVACVEGSGASYNADDSITDRAYAEREISSISVAAFEATKALALVSLDPEGRRAVRAHSALVPVVALLRRSPDAQAQSAAAECLLNASVSAALKADLRALGALQVLAARFADPLSDTPVRRFCARALCNAALSAANRVELARFGALEPAVAALAHSDSITVAYALRLLAHAAPCAQTAAAIVRAGAVARLVALVPTLGTLEALRDSVTLIYGLVANAPAEAAREMHKLDGLVLSVRLLDGAVRMHLTGDSGQNPAGDEAPPDLLRLIIQDLLATIRVLLSAPQPSGDPFASVASSSPSAARPSLGRPLTANPSGANSSDSNPPSLPEDDCSDPTLPASCTAAIPATQQLGAVAALCAIPNPTVGAIALRLEREPFVPLRTGVLATPAHGTQLHNEAPAAVATTAAMGPTADSLSGATLSPAKRASSSMLPDIGKASRVPASGEQSVLDRLVRLCAQLVDVLAPRLARPDTAVVTSPVRGQPGRSGGSAGAGGAVDSACGVNASRKGQKSGQGEAGDETATEVPRLIKLRVPSGEDMAVCAFRTCAERQYCRGSHAPRCIPCQFGLSCNATSSLAYCPYAPATRPAQGTRDVYYVSFLKPTSIERDIVVKYVVSHPTDAHSPDLCMTCAIQWRVIARP